MGCCLGLYRYRCDRFLHCGRLCSDLVQIRSRRDQRSSGSRRRPETLRWGVRDALVWRRSCECLVTLALPLATAYNVCEGLGFESSVDKRFSDARIFYSLYTFLIVLGARCVLIPNLPLLKVILLSQVANGVLIPFVLIFMLVLINRRGLMGEMRNHSWQNIVAGSTSIVMIALTAMMLWTSTRG